MRAIIIDVLSTIQMFQAWHNNCQWQSGTRGVGVWGWGCGGGAAGHTCSILTNSNYEGYSWMHCGTPRLCASKATCVSDFNGAIKTKWRNWQNRIDVVIPLTSMPYGDIMNITNRNEWLYFTFHNGIEWNIEYQYNFIFISLWVLKNKKFP